MEFGDERLAFNHRSDDTKIVYIVISGILMPIGGCTYIHKGMNRGKQKRRPETRDSINLGGDSHSIQHRPGTTRVRAFWQINRSTGKSGDLHALHLSTGDPFSTYTTHTRNICASECQRRGRISFAHATKLIHCSTPESPQRSELRVASNKSRTCIAGMKSRGVNPEHGIAEGQDKTGVRAAGGGAASCTVIDGRIPTFSATSSDPRH